MRTHEDMERFEVGDRQQSRTGQGIFHPSKRTVMTSDAFPSLCTRYIVTRVAVALGRCVDLVKDR